MEPIFTINVYKQVINISFTKNSFNKDKYVCHLEAVINNCTNNDKCEVLSKRSNNKIVSYELFKSSLNSLINELDELGLTYKLKLNQ
jgi:hypothetical protein